MSQAIQVLLKQHSPLIHFQYKGDTEEAARLQNATLRATEVKPRLDKFIIAQIEKNNKEIQPHWYVGKEKGSALDYKLQIRPATGRSPKIESIGTFKKDVYGSYFGDANGITWEDGLMVTFSSFETDVLDAIYQYIVSFFVLHNFGQRQTKGFGSFTVKKMNDSFVPSYQAGQRFGTSDVEEILKQYYGTFYKLNLDAYKNDYPNTKPLEQIQNEYQLLKAGKNHGGYEKSKLFSFFIDSQPRTRWEKRKVKQEINKRIGEEEYPFSDPLFKKTDKKYDLSQDRDADNRYVRALLGLAETNEYLVDDGTVNEFGKEIASKSKKYVISIEHEQHPNADMIERLASPILFKVIDDEVYLTPIVLTKNPILGKEFRFTLYAKEKIGRDWQDIKENSKLITKDLGTLKTPDSFDLLAFLDNALLINGTKKNGIVKIVWEKIA